MVIVKLQGGLGNQMFQYAAAYILSKRLKCPFKLDFNGFYYDWLNRSYSLDIFGIKAELATKEEIDSYFLPKSYFSMRRIFKIQKRGYSIIREPLDDLRYVPAYHVGKNNIYLDGYWQSDKYLKGFENEIRQLYSLDHITIPTTSLSLFEEIKSGNSVCINVRRADFTTNSVIGFIGKEYYERAYSKLNVLVKDPKCYIFSDDLEWCHANLDFIKDATFVCHEHAGERFTTYFKLMAFCKHFIIPNSSFAWWAAWLSNTDGHIIAPQKYLQDANHKIEVIPENWIKV